jgi:hypothetical protein
MPNGDRETYCFHCNRWKMCAGYDEFGWFCYSCYDWWCAWEAYEKLWYVVCAHRPNSPAARVFRNHELGYPIGNFIDGILATVTR